jgi:hypothetical protein
VPLFKTVPRGASMYLVPFDEEDSSLSIVHVLAPSSMPGLFLA